MPKFDEFIGNNHKRVPPSDYIRYNLIEVKSPSCDLDDTLWDFLINDLHISKLRIFRPNDARWLDGHGSGYCEIELDDNDKIIIIRYCPHIAHIYPTDVDKSGRARSGFASSIIQQARMWRHINSHIEFPDPEIETSEHNGVVTNIFKPYEPKSVDLNQVVLDEVVDWILDRLYLTQLDDEQVSDIRMMALEIVTLEFSEPPLFAKFYGEVKLDKGYICVPYNPF